ncbi:hypothetical protein [Actinomyces sp. 565]|uniref:hypothetical protein n=1 Tax=Actinomyces sp. 565 TaxID=2057794 RepID=UPI0013A6D30A|nr:hypothetical protein [Actinomyces sp. 565]NDR54013.1 hypothetical protein [Actinomyces sp. 565]
MSENTDVNQTEPGASAAPARRSRRAMREAERAAEREAFLTGQQPLLTRREMRRLREEAEALQRALESGEITPEQARALQDPLADQPVIPLPSHESSGSRAASATPATDGAADRTPTPATAQTPADPGAAAEDRAEAGAEGRSEGQAAAAQTTPTDTSDDAADVVASPTQQAETAAQPGRAPSAQTPALVPTAEQSAPPESAESAEDGAADVAAAAGAASAPSPQAADANLTEAQKEELASLPTGVMEAVDAPILSESEAAQPSALPTRRSLRNRLAAENAPTDGERPHDAAADEHEPGAGEDGAAGAGEAPSQSSDEQAQHEGVDSVPAAEENPAAVPARRPIVRIPSAAQGVRTVDTNTGELTVVQPVIQPDAALQVTGHSSADAAADSEHESANSADAAQAEAPEEAEPQPDPTEVYGGIDNPQWRSLDVADAAVPEAASSAATAAGTEAEAVPEAAADSKVAADGGSRVGHTLLIILLAVVIALVVLAIVWYLRSNGVIGTLSQALSAWMPLLT